jgi:hypothetical protein
MSLSLQSSALRFLMRTVVLSVATLFSTSLQAQSVVSVADTTGWSPWKLPGGNAITDVANDQQTGQKTDDFVGNSTTYAFQQKAGTIGGTNYILFRARMGDFQGVNQVGGNGMNLGVGFNLDNSVNGSIDLVMMMSKTNQTNAILQFGTPGTGANDGPSTTTWTFATQTPVTLTLYNPTSQNPTTANFYVQSATAVDGVKLNTGNTNVQDSWVTFGVTFATLQNAARTYSNNSASFSNFTVTYSTPLTMIGFTSTQANALNQDLAGVTGGIGNSASTSSFATLGATTIATTVDPAPVPEPSTFLMVPALLAPAVMVLRRRRRLAEVA